MLTTTWCELFLDWFACAMYLWHLLDVTPLRWCYVLMLRVVLIAYKTIDTNWSYVYQLCYPKLIPITSIAVADTQIYHSCKSSILPIVAEKFLLCMGFTSEPKFAARDHEELWEAQEGRHWQTQRTRAPACEKASQQPLLSDAQKGAPVSPPKPTVLIGMQATNMGSTADLW